MAPFNAWPVLFLTFPVVVWLIDGAGAGAWRGVPAAAMAGWWFGLGYFRAGTILDRLRLPGRCIHLRVADAVRRPRPCPLIWRCSPPSASRWRALIWTRDASRVIALAASLTLSEWLRGHVLTGFPWNTLGYALTEPLALAQTASLIGLWGLTFLSVAIFASPAVLIDGSSRGRRPWIAPAACAAAARRDGNFRRRSPDACGPP